MLPNDPVFALIFCVLRHQTYTHMCSYFSGFIPGFNGAILLVIGDVPVDNETPVVTSSISKFTRSTQFFVGAHMGRVYIRAFIRMNVRLCM